MTNKAMGPWATKVLLAVGLAMLLSGTVLVFLVFDRDSHSNSDTLRPFIITMGPVWVIAILAGRNLLNRR